MQIVYAFIYSFALFMTGLVASLLVFLAPGARKTLLKWWDTNQEFIRRPAIWYGIMLVFVVIGLVLFESIFSFMILRSHFSKSTHQSIQKPQG